MGVTPLAGPGRSPGGVWGEAPQRMILGVMKITPDFCYSNNSLNYSKNISVSELSVFHLFSACKQNIPSFFVFMVFVFALFGFREGYADTIQSKQIVPSKTHTYKILLGHIKKTVGDVRFKRGALKMKAAKEGQKIFVGDRIQTFANSRALFVFEDGADFRLGENTSLRMSRSILPNEKKQFNVAELFKGVLWAKVDPHKKKAIFQIRLPTVVVGIRGTELTAVFQDDVSTFFLKSGKLNVTGGDTEFIMKAGEMTANIGKRRPIKPLDVEEGGELQKVQERILEATSLESASTLKEKKEYQEILARFYINYASYLVDKKGHYDAITLLLMAKSLTKKEDVQAEISALLANIHARFLKNYEEAARYYEDVLTNYPHSPHYKSALFHYGLLLKTKGDADAAQKIFSRYLKEFADSKHRQIIEYFFMKIPNSQKLTPSP